MNNFSSSSNLPNPKLLFWAHSTCSKDELSAALTNLNITAIEADIVMGYEQNDINEVSPMVQPVMAHPPQYLSDLTFGTFIEMATTRPHSKDFQQKHLKLDFKEIATVRPVLESLHQVFCKSDDSFDQMVFLNADILAGPGKRYGKLEMEADIFIKECLGFAQKSEKHRSQCAFSLGWRVDCRSLGGYTTFDIIEMQELIEKYDLLEQSAGKCALSERHKDFILAHDSCCSQYFFYPQV
jgi:hypothetical protein